VRLAVHHAVTLLDGGLTNGLAQVAFSRATRTQEQRIFPLGDEGAGRQVEHQAAIHFWIESEIEVVQGFIGIAKCGLFAPAVE
jgi:hypothetical protein